MGPLRPAGVSVRTVLSAGAAVAGALFAGPAGAVGGAAIGGALATVLDAGFSWLKEKAAHSAMEEAVSQLESERHVAEAVLEQLLSAEDSKAALRWANTEIPFQDVLSKDVAELRAELLTTLPGFLEQAIENALPGFRAGILANLAEHTALLLGVALDHEQRSAERHEEVAEGIRDIKATLERQAAPGVQPAVGAKHVDDLLKRLQALANDLAESPIQFPRQVFLRNSYAELLEVDDASEEPRLTPRQFLDIEGTAGHLLHAPGGGGKTSFVVELCLLAAAEGRVPFFLDLSYNELVVDARDEDILKRAFATCSLRGAGSHFTQRIEAGQQTLLVVDGLNQVGSSLGSALLTELDSLARQYGTNLRIIITDRMREHGHLDAFGFAAMVPLSPDDIHLLLQEAGVEHPDSYDSTLLALPFFLDLQIKLKEGGPHQPSRRHEMFRRYFSRILSLEGEGLDDALSSLSSAAIEMYRKNRTHKFDSQEWCKLVAPEMHSRLVEASAIRSAEGGEDTSLLVFRHQLIHDYLVGHHLAFCCHGKWPGALLDSATFTASSVEPLSFAAEMIGVGADDFMLHLYNWNYPSTARVLSNLEHAGASEVVSEGLKLALVAMNAEKLFDTFKYSAHDAFTRLREMGRSLTRELASARDIEELATHVAERAVGGRWEQWQELFRRTPKTSSLDEDLIHLVHCPEPLMGWTAANVIRRFELDDEWETLLRGIHRLHPISPAGDNCGWERAVVRWRVVHALGRRGSPRNIDFMLSCAGDGDEEAWVRYGAVRNLMEIAFLTPTQRQRIVDELKRTLESEVPRLFTWELRRTVIVVGADKGWYDAALPLLELAAQKAERRDRDSFGLTLSEARQERASP